MIRRAVLDTNVLASAFVRTASVPGSLLAYWRAQRFDLVVSSAILEELERTLARRYFAAILSPDERRFAVLELVQGAMHVTVVAPPLATATHAEDDLILATVVEGRANYLVTGDR